MKLTNNLPLLLCAFAATALSQEALREEEPDELVTDRPDFTESAEVVGRANLQVETGFTFDKATLSGDLTRSLVGPLPLVRLGLSRRMELRLAGDGYTWQRFRSAGAMQSLGGRSDFSLGTKVKFFDQKGLRPDFAVIGAVSIPRGNPEFSSGGYDPEIKLCLAKDMPKGLAMSGNLNFSSTTDAEGRLFQRAASLSFGHAIHGDLAGYWEGYNVSLDRGLGSTTIFNMGITHPVSKRAQIDVSVGHSVAGIQTGWFIGVGFSIKQSLRFGR